MIDSEIIFWHILKLIKNHQLIDKQHYKSVFACYWHVINGKNYEVIETRGLHVMIGNPLTVWTKSPPWYELEEVTSFNLSDPQCFNDLLKFIDDHAFGINL